MKLKILVLLLTTITACGGSGGKEEEPKITGEFLSAHGGFLFEEPQDYNGDGILEAEEEFLIPEVFSCLNNGGQWIGYCDNDEDHPRQEFMCSAYEECEFLFCYCESWMNK